MNDDGINPNRVADLEAEVRELWAALKIARAAVERESEWHAIAIAERDRAWRQVARSEAERDEARAALARVKRFPDDPALRLSGHSGISVRRLRNAINAALSGSGDA